MTDSLPRGGTQPLLFESISQTVEFRPFLRWAGGKTRLLPYILPHVPRTFNDYYEPFLGGGAVFFAVRERARGRPILSDLNSELVDTWKAVRDTPDDLLAALRQYMGKDTEAAYYDVRAASFEDPLERAARFIYLNQTAWNSLWRVNKQGVFNVPWGARPFRNIEANELHAASRALRNASIEEHDFRQALSLPSAGDFVYLDPPYLPVSDTSKFSGYTGKRFRLHDLEALAQACRTLTSRGVHWVLSNRDTPTVRALFHDAKIVALTTRRAVAAQNRRDVEPVDSPEVVIIGGPRA